MNKDRDLPAPAVTPVRVALATCRAVPTLTEGDQRTLKALLAAGLDARVEVWDASSAHWNSYALVVVRSCWDYHRRPEEFRNWIRALEAAAVDVRNPPAVILWNLHKSYLLDLERAGVEVVPTELVPRGGRRRLVEILRRRRCTQAVFKPAVSASAHGTQRTRLADADQLQAAFLSLLEKDDVLVQPFLPELTRGELSLLFLGGRYSHAVLKRAAPGEFRVQAEFGGSTEPATPSPAVCAAAQQALAAAQSFVPDVARCLYARVDGTVRSGRFVVTELELIEPHLFLEQAPGAPERFAAAIVAAVDRS